MRRWGGCCKAVLSGVAGVGFEDCDTGFGLSEGCVLGIAIAALLVSDFDVEGSLGDLSVVASLGSWPSTDVIHSRAVLDFTA